MELSFTKTSSKKFDEAVAKVEEQTAAKGFRVLHIHDVQATLSEKGFKRDSYKIIEICNAKFAYNALNVSPDIGLFIPCKINVYTKDGQTVISAMRPSMISEFFDNTEIKALAAEVDKIVRSIVDDSI